jgi:eukaryotic-like serine/threonine-protein kinase
MVIKRKIVPNLPQKINNYKIIRHLGRGGMGEVFLAFDAVCNRSVALKRIRKDKIYLNGIKERFFKEARIASQLTHPSIIPIYNIFEEENNCHYTMAYIEGNSLKEIIISESQKYPDKYKYSIQELTRFFLNICEAVAYTHEKGVLHRDLKPDNFMIGKFGEVMILDWGIAETIEKSLKIPTTATKIAGTIGYLAPERALLKPSSVLTDIYALGAILYQILTLKVPFVRESLAHFRSVFEKEKLIDPIEVAPYREIPDSLSQIAKKCLSYKPYDRYQSVKDLIKDLKLTIEGKPKWTHVCNLSIKEKSDWKFQENIFLTKHIAISKSLDFLEWVNLAISKQSFAGNIRIKTSISFSNENTGIGILFSIPSADKKKSLEEGYHLWINPKGFELYRNNVFVVRAITQTALKTNTFHQIEIEKTDHHVRLFINKQSILNYFSYLPIAGTHIGLLSKHISFQLALIEVLSSSHTVKVNCLAVPDAFLIHKNFDIALQEYRRIGKSFPGRSEGREAMFRAGITLLEKAKSIHDERQKDDLFSAALEEFSKLHNTTGAPLEYLGKSLVYSELKEFEEEAKCLELACRKYNSHPLINRLKEHLTYRIHECSLYTKEATFRLIFLTLNVFPEILSSNDSQNLLQEIKKSFDYIYFCKVNDDSFNELLSFWIGKQPSILEMLENKKSSFTLLFALLELDMANIVRDEINHLTKKLEPNILEKFKLISTDIPIREKLEKIVNDEYEDTDFSFYYYLMNQAIDKNEFNTVKDFLDLLVSDEQKSYLDLLKCLFFLYNNEIKLVENILINYPYEVIIQQFNFIYLCFLTKTKQEKKLIKLIDWIDESKNCHSQLLGKYLYSNQQLEPVFYWEKKQLHRQLTLYYHCIENFEKKDFHFNKISKI